MEPSCWEGGFVGPQGQLRWSASSPHDDAPRAPLCLPAPDHCPLAGSDASSSEGRPGSGRTLPRALPCFPGEPGPPRAKPSLEPSPPGPCPSPSPRAGLFRRRRARVPLSPICGPGGGRSTAQAEQSGEPRSPLHPVTQCTPTWRRTPHPVARGLPTCAACQSRPAAASPVSEARRPGARCPLVPSAGWFQGACALGPHSTRRPWSPRPPAVTQHSSLSAVSPPFSCAQRLCVECVLRA